MRLKPEQRRLIVKLAKWLKKSFVAKLFKTSRVTVWKWCKRAKKARHYSFRDKPRVKKKRKVTEAVELSILKLRRTFKWGTARIQQGLQKLPSFMKKVLGKLVQGFQLSRQAINNILKERGFNGYSKNYKHWKFFRAKEPNKLWQLDIKGPFRLQGKKYWFVICLDDYSRYMLLAKQFEHSPTTEEIEQLIEPFIKKYKPDKILTDNNPFGKSWEKWCKEKGVEAVFAHPYYPQDKGKVERGIGNLNREFIYLLRNFPQWLNGSLESYRRWYNKDRFHHGVNARPAELFFS